MAGKISLVAECCLAPITFVWLVTMDLKHVAFQNLLVCEFGVAFVTEVCTVFCKDQDTKLARKAAAKRLRSSQAKFN